MPSTRMMRASEGVDIAKIVAQRVIGNFAERAGKLHARRSAADDHERHPGAELLRVGLALGRFERQKNLAAHVRGIVHVFQAGRKFLPIVVAKILVAGAGGHDQRVIINRAVAEHHAVVLRVDADNLRKQHLGVFLAFQDVAKRSGNICGRK